MKKREICIQMDETTCLRFWLYISSGDDDDDESKYSSPEVSVFGSFISLFSCVSIIIWPFEAEWAKWKAWLLPFTLALTSIE